MTTRPVSRDTARLFLVRRHFLAPPRSLPPGREGVLTAFARLGSVQFDPLEVAGRNHDLVLLSRVAGYRREMTDTLLYEERTLFEAYNKGLSLLPTAELPWYRLTWDRHRAAYEADEFQTHAVLVTELLDRIRAEGPRSSADWPARPPIAWSWRPTNPIRAMLEALAQSGILALAGRRGNQRLYDFTEHLFPAELLAQRPDPAEQRRHRLLSRYRAHGMLGRTGSAELWIGTAPSLRSAEYDGPTRGELVADLITSGELLPIAVDGVRGDRFILAAEMDLLDAAERHALAHGPAHGWEPLDPDASGVAILAPLDPFVWDREFLRALFGFDYIWEVYVKEAKRQWGYYVLPILWGDRLVGRIEPRIDRPADALRILDAHWETGFDPLAQPAFLVGLAAALEAHRAFAGLGRVLLPRTAKFSGLRTALAAHLAALGRPAAREPSARRAPGARAGRAGLGRATISATTTNGTASRPSERGAD